MKLLYPELHPVRPLQPGHRRIFIGAYGFEERSLGWIKKQQQSPNIINESILLNYKNPKGKNKIEELRAGLLHLGSQSNHDIDYDVWSPQSIEDGLEEIINEKAHEVDEIIIDISAMTKLAILIVLCKLRRFHGKVRIVYTEANRYSPTKQEYDDASDRWEINANSPSRGVESIVRARCLSSIRMQGQPVVLIMFASFNEQLVRQMLATINPHKFILINGKPPRNENIWRERATQKIHKKMIEEYSKDNPLDAEGNLIRTTSTLYYSETINLIDEIYLNNAIRERIMCVATGSKMQTVGLFFCKMAHPDIHVEYLTPDSYFSEAYTEGIREVHELEIENYEEFIDKVEESTSNIFNIPDPENFD